MTFLEYIEEELKKEEEDMDEMYSYSYDIDIEYTTDQ